MFSTAKNARLGIAFALDVVTALAWMTARYPGAPYVDAAKREARTPPLPAPIVNRS